MTMRATSAALAKCNGRSGRILRRKRHDDSGAKKKSSTVSEVHRTRRASQFDRDASGSASRSSASARRSFPRPHGWRLATADRIVHVVRTEDAVLVRRLAAAAISPPARRVERDSAPSGWLVSHPLVLVARSWRRSSSVAIPRRERHVASALAVAPASTCLLYTSRCV